MVGIVIVSHSATLAAGVQQIVEQMVHGRVPFALAGGTESSSDPIGTDPIRVLQAIEAVYSDDGVLVLMDLGSAIMSAEAAIELLPPAQQAQIYLCEAPLVEGALAAAVAAAGGAPMARVLAEARAAQSAKLAQLAPILRPDPPLVVTPATARAQRAPGSPNAKPLAIPLPEFVQTFTVPNRLGLHARPAARLVELSSGYEADVTIWNGERMAQATSINQLITLGARQGDELTIHARGWEAAEVLAAIADLMATHLGDYAAHAIPVAQAPVEAKGEERVDQLRGTPIAAGIAFGPAVMLITAPPLVERRFITNVVAEQTRFHVALDTVLRALMALEQNLAARSAAAPAPPGREAEILAAQRLMLMDPALLERVHEDIAIEQCNAEWIWQAVLTEVDAQYQSVDDAYLRRRVADWRDVGERLLRLLTGQPPVLQTLTTPGILVVEELAPSVAAALDPALVLGIVTARGGANDHSAILARTLGIPAVTGVEDVLAHLSPGRWLALDGASGTLWLDPDPATVAQLTDQRTAWLAEQAAVQSRAHWPAMTRDGVPITVAANIGAVAEIEAALAQGAAGVGLFRTELLFMAQRTLPDEEGQYQSYRHAATALGGYPLTVRTLDIGGDKPLPHLALEPEPNPFLGWRGLRYCLDNLDIFRPQLRALLRAAGETHGSFNIMLPMVSTLDEVLAAKALLATEAARLAAAGLAPATLPPIGIMIETPAAVFNAPQLAQQVDFFSIGTNDLTQYLMAADRSNARVATLVNAFQPAVLRAIAQVVQAAQGAGIPISVCGEMAADPRATALLIGLGVSELSVNVHALPQIKAQIRQLDWAHATTIAQHVLTLPTAAAVEAYLGRE